MFDDPARPGGRPRAVFPRQDAAMASLLKSRAFRRLKVAAASTFIGGYLLVLGGGVASHALGVGQNAHPLMYFVVWDMFCGWSAQSTRTHVLAEGVSGAWYDAGTGPWEAFTPYGDLPRIHYDTQGVHAPRLALNVLRHTEHEPIDRLVVVEESWPKKFNLPEDLWRRRFGAEKEPVSYFAVRHVISGDGRLAASNPNWADAETARLLAAAVKPKAESPLRVVGFARDAR